LSFREKLLDLKRRLSDRKMYSIVIVVIGAISIWGLYQYKHAANLRQQLDNQYNRAFYDMVGYVNNVDVLLMKSLISATPTRTAATLQEAWRQANLAQANLGQIPVAQQVLANTSKFLTQVGDLSYSLNNQSMQGKNLTDDQYKTIERLYGYSASLSKSLNDLQMQITTGRIKWGELANRGTSVFKKTSTSLPSQQFENIDKQFTKYPTLIYDGPFSDHLAKVEAKGLTGDKITREQAKKRVQEVLGADRISAVTDNGANNAATFKTYSFIIAFKNAPDKQTATVDITQKGGHLYQMVYTRPVQKSKLNIDQAKAAGKKFLDSHGYPSMKDTYYLKEDNTAIINYAYQQGDVTVYSDLIKVKVALDNGEIIGFESKGYLSAHTVRKITQPKISVDEARKKISTKVKLISSGMAIIPTDYRTELLTYEFKGKLNNKDFLVYINVETGVEENILLLLDTPRGVLTM
jgi:spore germination protein